MVPLDTALVSFYRPSIVTMSLSEVGWPQFAMQSFREHQFPAYLLTPEVIYELDIKQANKRIDARDMHCI